MKKIVKSFMPAVYLIVIAFSAASCNKTQAAPAAVAAPGQPVDLTYAAEKSLPAVVYIKSVINSKVQTVEYSDPFEDFFSDPFGGFFGRGQGNNGNGRRRQVQTPKRAAAGSGVIISADGYIVTNNHVVDGADELTVTLNENSKDITIANSDDVKVGEWVLAVGNPLGLNNTVTAGIVSAKARSMATGGITSMIQTDAAINQGNSGGALVNTRGELIGINAMLASPTGSNIGYGFAIPTSIVKKAVEDFKKYGTYQRAMIGIQGGSVKDYIDSMKDQEKEVKDYGTMEGVRIENVVEDGAAADAGLEKEDVITAVNGQKVKDMGELQGILAQKRPGEQVKVTYLRNKKEKTVTMTLKNEQGTTKMVKNADVDVLGIDVRPITDSQKKQLEINYGLEVLKVNGGKMKEAGVPKGFIIQTVNDKSMRTFDDLQDVVKDAGKSKDQMLVIKGMYPTGKRGGFVVYLQNE